MQRNKEGKIYLITKSRVEVVEDWRYKVNEFIDFIRVALGGYSKEFMKKKEIRNEIRRS